VVHIPKKTLTNRLEGYIFVNLALIISDLRLIPSGYFWALGIQLYFTRISSRGSKLQDPSDLIWSDLICSDLKFVLYLYLNQFRLSYFLVLGTQLCFGRFSSQASKLQDPSDLIRSDLICSDLKFVIYLH
jgi:hypothetical protein